MILKLSQGENIVGFVEKDLGKGAYLIDIKDRKIIANSQAKLRPGYEVQLEVLDIKTKRILLKLLSEPSPRLPINTLFSAVELENFPKELESLEKLLNSLFLNLSRIDGEAIKEAIRNSGLFFIDKLILEPFMETFLTDIRGILILMKKEVKDKKSNFYKKILSLLRHFEDLSGKGLNFFYLPVLIDDRKRFIKLDFERIKGKEKTFKLSFIIQFVQTGRILVEAFFIGKEISAKLFFENRDFFQFVRPYSKLLRKNLEKAGFLVRFLDFFYNLPNKKEKESNFEVRV